MKKRSFRHGAVLAWVTALSSIAVCATAPASAQQHNIKDPTGPTPHELLGMVRVAPGCSGMLIAPDTVLTAAHCVCGDSYVRDPDCKSTAQVTFRPDPEQPALPERVMNGTVSVHPLYNPSWVETQFEYDFAIIKLKGVAPGHAKPYPVARGYLPVGATAMVAGYGRNGAGCSNPYGTLGYDFAPVHDYEDGHDIMVFSPQVLCPGDSGGAVLDEQGEVLYAVHSLQTDDVVNGNTNKCDATGPAFDWIKGHICLSSNTNSCTNRGAPCTCSATSNILWQNSAGQLAIWTMSSEVIESHAYPGAVGSDWQIKGNGDFNGDGESDILWRHNTGQVAIWHMRNGAIASATYPGGTDAAQAWKIQGSGDFDGDTRADILWRHVSGLLAIWFAGKSEYVEYPGHDNAPAPVDNAWKVTGIGDFNGDSMADIVWRHTNGQVSLWMMSGATLIDEAYPGGLDPTQFWKVQGVGDFDGNLHSDILWRSNSGLLAIWFDGVDRSDTLTYQNKPGTIDASWQVQAIGDFDHNGRDDILWRDSNGQPAIWLVNGARFVADVYPPWVDNSWQIKGLLHDE